jgi:hypothetical protein
VRNGNAVKAACTGCKFDVAQGIWAGRGKVRKIYECYVSPEKLCIILGGWQQLFNFFQVCIKKGKK